MKGLLACLLAALAIGASTGETMKPVGYARPGVHASSDPNYSKTVKHVLAMLASIRVPGGAQPLAHSPAALLDSPTIVPMDEHLVDRARWWTVATSMHATIAWFHAHMPRGFSVDVSTSTPMRSALGVEEYVSFRSPANDVYENPVLAVAATPLGSGAAIRVDGMASWESPPREYSARKPVVRVTVSRGCPKHLRAADVSNPRSDLTLHLLPRHRTRAGLLCAFRRGARMRSVRLSGLQARLLAREVAASPLRLVYSSCEEFVGKTSRPQDPLRGVAIVLALRYPKRSDADLHYVPEGCSRHLDNGHISTEVMPLSFDVYIKRLLEAAR